MATVTGDHICLPKAVRLRSCVSLMIIFTMELSLSITHERVFKA